MLDGTFSARFVSRDISIQGNMSTRAVAIILRGLCKLKLDGPVDLRTLLGAPRVTPVINLFNGKHIHFSLEECLHRFREYGGIHSWYHRIENSR